MTTMNIEQIGRPNDPPIVEPKEFLLKPFEKLEVGELIKPPDINFLKWLPKVSDETGLVYQKPRWFVIKASDHGVPSWIMPQNSDILLHSHPHEEKGIKNAEAIPSMRDFLNCSPLSKNFIVSQNGITKYQAVEPKTKQRLEMEIVRGRSFNKHKIQEYLQFLEDIGAIFEVYSWKKLNDEKLATLLY